MSRERFAVDLGNGLARLNVRAARNLYRTLGAWLRDQDAAPSEYLLADDLARIEITRARLASSTDPDDLALIADFAGDVDRAAEALSSSSFVDAETAAFRARLEARLAAAAESRNIR